MRLEQMGAELVHQMTGRLVRRAIAGLAVVLALLAALYQFTVAGTIALELEYGAMSAHAIVGGLYTALALIAFAVYRTQRKKPASGTSPAIAGREMQYVMLAEALMLGYALARKSDGSR